MTNSSHDLLNYIRTVAGAWRDDPRDDALLLARFVENRDEQAFTTLMWRHGAMVWRSCQRVIGSGPDIEDAFQATFLAMSRQAAKLRANTLAGWLHKIARRAALKFTRETKQRRNLEQQLQTVTPAKTTEENRRNEFYAAIDEELAGLPERLRVPLILHYLEGKTQEDSARILGCSRRDLGRRLERGEVILRQRMERRGLTLGAGSIAVLLKGPAGSSALPADLIKSTARAAMAFRGGALAGASADAAEKLLRSLSWKGAMGSKWWVVMVASFLGMGGISGLLAWKISMSGEDADVLAIRTTSESVSPKTIAKTRNEKLDCYGDPLPVGALARMGTTRLRFAKDVPVFTRDGKAFFTGWRADTGPLWSIALWDVATGKLLRQFDRDPKNGYPRSIILSADERFLLGLVTEHVCVWDVASGKLLHHCGEDILEIALSTNGKTFIALDRDRQISFWEIATGQIMRAHKLNLDDNHGLDDFVFSGDGKVVAVVPRLGKTLQLWNVATGKKLYQLTYQLSWKRGWTPASIAFSLDGLLLAIGSESIVVSRGIRPATSDGAICLLETATGKELRRFGPDKAGTVSVAFSSDGKLLATGSGSGSIRLWDVATGKQVGECKGNRACVTALKFSPDSRTLASSSSDEQMMRLWEVATGKEVSPAAGGHTADISSVAFLPDGKSLITGSMDGTVRFWDAETGRERRSPLQEGDCQAFVALSADGKTFASVGSTFLPNERMTKHWTPVRSSTIVRIRDTATGDEQQRFTGPNDFVRSLLLSSDNKVLTMKTGKAGPSSLYQWDIATGKKLEQFKPEPTEGAALSPDGKFMISGGWDDKYPISLWETSTNKKICDLDDGEEGVSRWWNFAISPDSRAIAAAGRRLNSNTVLIRLWQLQKIGEIMTCRGFSFPTSNEHGRGVKALAFSPDAKTLASAEGDGIVQLWETATGKERCCFNGKNGQVTSLAFTSDGRRLAAGNYDSTILVWDVTGCLQDGHLQPVQLPATEINKLWADLADVDAARASRALWTLAAAPAQTVSFLQEHLRPVVLSVDEKTLCARLIANLDNDNFEIRQKATEELEKLAGAVEPMLRQALVQSASLEVQNCLGKLLKPLEDKWASPAGEILRRLRALEVLGQINTHESRQLLKTLAGGEPEARLTREAQAVLQCRRNRQDLTRP